VNVNDNHIDEVELKRLGIRRVEANVFQRGEYLYASVHDAIAAAKKDQKA
jgi:hypothetical protein